VEADEADARPRCIGQMENNAVLMHWGRVERGWKGLRYLHCNEGVGRRVPGNINPGSAGRCQLVSAGVMGDLLYSRRLERRSTAELRLKSTQIPSPPAFGAETNCCRLKT